MRRILALIGLLLPLPAAADDIGAALRGDRWADASAIASVSADPVAQKLVLYYRLLSPGGGRSGEIASFMAQNPTWPNQPLLARRLAEALQVEPDDRVVQDICQHHPVREASSLLRCAVADVHTGQAAAAGELARQAWLTGITDPAAETAFMRQWGREISAADQWTRFERLAWSESGAAGTPAWRQVARLDPALRSVAEARLALRRNDPSAGALVTALPGGATTDPALMLDYARWLRRVGRDDEALHLWLTAGPTEEQAASPEQRAAFWDERNTLARRRLKAGDGSGAYALVTGAAGLKPEQAVDADFLSGYIALRLLNDPEAAIQHFKALASLSHAAITQGRAWYWLGRSEEAAHDPSGARKSYETAAAWPTTFYGQLASHALGEDEATLTARIRAVKDPAWSSDQAMTFIGSEDARAAALLVAWGEPNRARAFVTRLGALAENGSDHALAAYLAIGLGLPDLAVAIARRAGGEGEVMAEAGWPLAVSPPPGSIEPALALGLIRQESNFNADAMSPAGARGLMQLMPATAQAMARRLDAASLNVSALTTDPAYNMKLGSAYLGMLMQQFGGTVPYAVAGYNAGPSRVGEWLATNGTPGVAGFDMLDWIELIPFGETRNYVQRVIENMVIYRALLGTALPHPLAKWLG